MKVFDIIKEEDLVRDIRMPDTDQERKNDMGVGIAGAGVAGGIAADRMKTAKGGPSIAKAVGADVAHAGRVMRKYKGDAVMKALMAKVIPQATKRAAYKSIPLIGVVIGGYYAAQQVAKGSLTSAGLELVGSLGSAFTSIPATAWLLARDMYDQLFYDPEYPDAFLSVEADLVKDPSGTKERLGFLAESLGDALRDAFGIVKKAYADPSKINWDADQTKAVTGNVPAARRAARQSNSKI